MFAKSAHPRALCVGPGPSSDAQADRCGLTLHDTPWWGLFTLGGLHPGVTDAKTSPLRLGSAHLPVLLPCRPGARRAARPASLTRSVPSEAHTAATVSHPRSQAQRASVALTSLQHLPDTASLTLCFLPFLFLDFPNK